MYKNSKKVAENLGNWVFDEFSVITPTAWPMKEKVIV